MNGDFRDGYCALPMSNTTERRASAAICYLDAAVRARPNLTIVTRANVTEAAVRRAARHRRRGDRRRAAARISRARDHPVRRRAAHARDAAARRDRTGGRSARARHRGARGPSRRRAQSAEPSGAVHRRASAARGAAAAKPAHLAGLVLPALVRTCAIVRRPTCSSICRASRRGMRWASRSPTSARCCGSRFRAAACR